MSDERTNLYGEDEIQENIMQTEARNNYKQVPKKKKGNFWKKAIGLVASALIFGVIAGLVMTSVNIAGNRLAGYHQNANKELAVVTTGTIRSSDGTTYDVADMAEEVLPSIVSITSTSVQTVPSWFYSFEEEVRGSGSGIIIGKNGNEIMIVTNYHVVEGTKELTVAFCDEKTVIATVKGYDAMADLAVLTVNVSALENSTINSIKVAALGDSDQLRVGEVAVAIGNALGYGQSVTVGHISGLDREIPLDSGNKVKLIQTDAAINPGNSGGALLNLNGEVIGINTVKYVDYMVESMGYAIPISTANPIINDLMNKEVIEEKKQGYLGIQGNDVTEEYMDGFNMPQGVYVVKIVGNSPADKSGLHAGDIIVEFDGREINNMKALQNILSGKKAGDEVECIVQRSNAKGEYEEVKLTVTLGAKADMPME